MNRTPHPSIAALMVLGSCVSLQFGAAIATPLFGVFGPALTTAGRLLLAGAVLVAVFRPRFWTWTRRQWGAVLLFGVAMAGMNACFYASIDRIPLGIAVTIEFIGPLALAAVLSRRLRDIGWVLLAGAAIVVLGLDGTGDGRPLDIVGVLFALAAGGFWAGYILSGTRVGALVPGHGALAMAVVVGAAVVAPFGIGSAGALAASPALLLPLAAVAVLSSVIPYTLEFASMRGLDPRAFGVLLSLEPAVATLAGWMLLGQSVTWLHIAAMAAVVVASTGSTLGAARRPAPAPARDVRHDTPTAPTPVAG
ncbi:EamA family transporter [Leifsonia sp. NPDC080035]|uniref:EamA family transporter n=1 Tax=Leifsonia sp. NPDC080035 TaxID=3143936 RepID=A0AAU7G595_9MICO